jgi:hypothetical protein
VEELVVVPAVLRSPGVLVVPEVVPTDGVVVVEELLGVVDEPVVGMVVELLAVAGDELLVAGDVPVVPRDVDPAWLPEVAELDALVEPAVGEVCVGEFIVGADEVVDEVDGELCLVVVCACSASAAANSAALPQVINLTGVFIDVRVLLMICRRSPRAECALPQARRARGRQEPVS